MLQVLVVIIIVVITELYLPLNVYLCYSDKKIAFKFKSPFMCVSIAAWCVLFTVFILFFKLFAAEGSLLTSAAYSQGAYIRAPRNTS